MTLRTALLQGAEILEKAGVPAPRLTAEVLLAFALRRDRIYLIAHSNDELSELTWIHYGRYLHERTKGRPTQYITKVQEFFGRDFAVSPAVLIPRPETEHLVETVLRRASGAATIVDIGTGSGAIAVSIQCERPGTSVWATDVSLAAVRVAAANAARHEAPLKFVVCDLGAALRTGRFDVVASNPPYIPLRDRETLQREVRDYEPALALYGGESGSEVYGRLIPEAERLLVPGGLLALELGYNSLEQVRGMIGGGPWSGVEVAEDLAGIPRVLSALYTP